MTPKDDQNVIPFRPAMRPRPVAARPPDLLDRLALLLALPRGLRVRAELRALDARQMADAGLSEAERARQIRLPLAHYTETRQAAEAWRRRLGRLLG